MARPHMVRLMVFNRLICPSTGPVLHGTDSALRIAARSRASPSANPASAVSFAAANQESNLSALNRAGFVGGRFG